MKERNLLLRLFVCLILGYQYLLGPILPKVCRFYPSCSEYAKEALLKYGLRKGLLLSVKRILRCHPFCKGGYDPL